MSPDEVLKSLKEDAILKVKNQHKFLENEKFL
jgi:hypothetical protein